MDSTRMTILIVGIALAVTVYLLWKLFEWRRNRSAQGPAAIPRPAAKAKSSDPYAIPEPKYREGPSPVPADGPSPVPTDDVVVPVKAPEPVAAVPPVVASVPPAVPRRVAPRPAAQPVIDDYEEYPYADQGDYAFGTATPVLAAMVPSSSESRDKETRFLHNAGFYSPHAWHNFSAYRYLAIILPILVCGALLLIAPEALEPWLMGGLIVLPLIGWALPAIYVQSRAQSRLREIGNGMPDMLDLLNMCVSQGMTLPSSLRRVSTDIAPVYPDLAKELKIVTEQARVGSLDQALTGFSNRVDLPEVHSFTSLLIQTERMGTSVSSALNDYSDNIRQSMRQRADEKANSAAFWMLFPTVFCLMTAVFLFLMGPAIIQLTDFTNRDAQALDISDELSLLNQEQSN